MLPVYHTGSWKLRAILSRGRGSCSVARERDVVCWRLRVDGKRVCPVGSRVVHVARETCGDAGWVSAWGNRGQACAWNCRDAGSVGYRTAGSVAVQREAYRLTADRVPTRGKGR